MSKVSVNSRQSVVPPEYFSTLKPSTRAYEQIIKVQPLITSFTSTAVPYKIVTELPNVNFRLNQVYLEANVTVNFTSSDVKDTYATVSFLFPMCVFFCFYVFFQNSSYLFSFLGSTHHRQVCYLLDQSSSILSGFQ